MEISITWNICRVCLQEENKNPKSASEQMIHIFNEDKKLVHYIYEFAGVFMKSNDSLPDKICLKCLNMINNAVQFRKNCRNSNAYLLSILERTKKASSMFKPDILEQDGSDNVVGDEEGKMETETEENVIEHSKLVNQQEEKKADENLEPVVKKVQEEQEEESSHYITDSTTELEVIIEVSEENPYELNTQIVEEKSDEIIQNKNFKKEKINSNSNNIEAKSKTSQLQKFLMNESFTKKENNEEKQEETYEGNNNDENLGNGADNVKKNNEDLYYLLKNEKNENSNSNDRLKDFKDFEEQLIVADENIELYEIEEPVESEENIEDDLVLHLEDEEYDDNDNQAHVSSTVDTNDEIEYHEENSQKSNEISDLDEILIEDDNLEIHDNSSQESNTTKVNKEKRSSPIIFPRPKIKRKYATNHSVSASLTNAADSPFHINVCEICGNQFANRSVMNMHMKVHFQEKNHQCEICFKGFITACNLQAHMRIHTGEKPFECKYCGRRFNDRTSNLRHERTHTNEKPFKCASCGKKFTLATTLQNHIKVHTNERSYRCEPCGKSFKLPHHLKTHQNTSLHRSVLQIDVRNN